MSIEEKKQTLETLRLGFIGLMNIVMQCKSSQFQKQQAMIRFDEGHMWLQNGIMSFADEPAPTPNEASITPSDPVNEPVGQPAEHHAIGDNCQDQQQVAQPAVA